MVRENQITGSIIENIFICNACDERTFTSYHNLLQHCRTAKTHIGEWCESCKWLFVSPVALNAHLHNSRDHWICTECQLDIDNEEDFESHMALAHSWCCECDRRFVDHQQHRIEIHNRCGTCDREFATSNELSMVRRIYEAHMIANVRGAPEASRISK